MNHNKDNWAMQEWSAQQSQAFTSSTSDSHQNEMAITLQSQPLTNTASKSEMNIAEQENCIANVRELLCQQADQLKQYRTDAGSRTGISMPASSDISIRAQSTGRLAGDTASLGVEVVMAVCRKKLDEAYQLAVQLHCQADSEAASFRSQLITVLQEFSHVEQLFDANVSDFSWDGFVSCPGLALFCTPIVQPSAADPERR